MQDIGDSRTSSTNFCPRGTEGVVGQRNNHKVLSVTKWGERGRAETLKLPEETGGTAQSISDSLKKGSEGCNGPDCGGCFQERGEKQEMLPTVCLFVCLLWMYFHIYSRSR